MTAVGDALRGPAAGERHQERAERDEYGHAPLLSDGRRPAHITAPGASHGLVAGVGARRGVSVDEVVGLVTRCLREAGPAAGRPVALATVAGKADEPGVVGAAARLGLPLRVFAAEELARIPVPHPSAGVAAAAGTPSVAEAAALAAAGRGGRLLVSKRTSRTNGGTDGARAARATCAIARCAPNAPDMPEVSDEGALGARLLSERHGYSGGESAPGAPAVSTARGRTPRVRERSAETHGSGEELRDLSPSAPPAVRNPRTAVHPPLTPRRPCIRTQMSTTCGTTVTPRSGTRS
ncbi:cobalamin biosynthesis protein [Streptomyces sp. NPDC048604]|uniref:cobalamin biosynthesis protein n=1 Tax=Streptomyces sp. NPDC048604 TaxID=3365578 RepID=UPI003724BF2C